MIIQGISITIASWVDKTSFTRIADGTGMFLSVLIVFYLTYQLGNTGISIAKRILITIISALLILAWSFVMLYIQVEFLHKSS